MLELQRELRQGLQAQADSMQELCAQVQRLQGDMQMQTVAMQETQKLLQDSSDRARPHSSTLSTSSTFSTPSTPAAEEQRVQRIEDETTRVAARACTASAKRDPGPLEGIGNGVAGGGRGDEHLQAPCARVPSPGAAGVGGESSAARSSRHNVNDDRPRRVLVVDEDRGHCTVVSKLLAKDFADLHVDVAHDAEAALQLLVASVSSPASESSCADDYDLVLIAGPEIFGRPVVDLVRSFREVQERQEPGAQEAGIEGRGGGGGENFRGRKVEFVAAVKTNEDAIALYASAWPEVARGGGDARSLSGDSILMKPIKREPLRALVCAALLEGERRDERLAEGNMLSKHTAQDSAGGRKQSRPNLALMTTTERKANAVQADGKGFYQQTRSHDLTEPGGMDRRQAFAATMQREDAARGRAGVSMVVHAEEEFEVQDRVVAMDALASGPALARAPELQEIREMLGGFVSEGLQAKVSANDSDCEDAVAHRGDATMAQDHTVHCHEPILQLK